MLTSESFNALLKTLEEPPAHVIFILATTELHKLPATIISRTQRHNFRLVPEAKVASHLKHIARQESIEIDDESLELLAIHGGGSFRDSISLLDQLSAHSAPVTKELVQSLFGLASQSHLQTLLDHALSGNSREVIVQLELLAENGLTPSAIASQLISLLRKIVKTNSGDADHINLMTKLMTVQTAQFPMLMLETILLGIAPAPAAPKSSPRTVPDNVPEPVPAPEVSANPIPESVSQVAEEVIPPKSKVEEKVEEPKKVSLNPKKVISKSGAILEKWTEVLEATKKKNNPLYTVLRLATPEVDEEGLLLIFNFPFHQKKIDEVKHKTLIAQIIEEVTGESLVIRTIVDKSRAKPASSLSAEPKTDPAHASLISNVQDIMGGGEVVNV
jgi:DNA polymerase-3 subunit gamma/tau